MQEKHILNFRAAACRRAPSTKAAMARRRSKRLWRVGAQNGQGASAASREIIMPEFYSLEKPPPKEVEKLVRELREFEGLKTRLTFGFLLNQNRKDALEMIKSGRIDEETVVRLLESNDFVERQTALYLLKQPTKISEKTIKKALPLLEKMSQDEQEWVRREAILALGNLGEKALPLLEKLSQDEKGWVRGQAALALGNLGEKALPLLENLSQGEKGVVRGKVALALGNLGEKALPLLEKMSQEKDPWVREKAIRALGNLGEKALPLLEKMSRDEEGWVRRQAAMVLGNLGEKALPLLEKLSQGENVWVRGQAALALGNLGEKALPLLEKLSRDEARWVREKALFSINKIKEEKKEYHPWLLAAKKALFATPYTRELAERLQKINRVSKELKDKYGDKFIGITVFGSTAKGYFEKESDLDWAVIARDKEVSEEFKKTAESLRLCHEHYAGVGEGYKILDNPESLFYGLFFGDHQELQELQKTTVENTDEKEWDRIRKKIMDNELNILKARERYGIKKEDLEKIQQFISLLRVPPSRKEALEIARRRVTKNLKI